MKQRSFITIFRLVGECYEQDNSSFRYELLLRKCRDVASSGTCRKADGSWGRSGSKTWNCADCELYCKASRSKNRYGIVAGKASLPGNNFCTASHGSLFEVFQNGTGAFGNVQTNGIFFCSIDAVVKSIGNTRLIFCFSEFSFFLFFVVFEYTHRDHLRFICTKKFRKNVITDTFIDCQFNCFV